MSSDTQATGRAAKRHLFLICAGAVYAWLAFSGVPATATAQLNLVVNPDFDTDIANWADLFPDPDTQLSWSSTENQGGLPGSGSLEQRSFLPSGAADGPTQCFSVTPGETYHVEAYLFRPGGQIETPFPYLFVNLIATPNCLDPEIDSATAYADFPGEPDTWELLELDIVAPAGAQQMSVRLMNGGQTAQTVAYWDSIFVPEPGFRNLTAFGALALILWKRSHEVRRSRHPS